MAVAFFWIILFGHITFEYCDGGTIDILSSIDVIYCDGIVSDQIFGHVRFESGQTWTTHLLLKFYCFVSSLNFLLSVYLFVICYCI